MIGSDLVSRLVRYYRFFVGYLWTLFTKQVPSVLHSIQESQFFNLPNKLLMNASAGFGEDVRLSVLLQERRCKFFDNKAEQIKGRLRT